MYDKVTCRINDKIEVEKHYSARYGAPGMPRNKKRKPTPEEMARQNCWRKRRELRRLIELNFHVGDFHAVLTCRKDCRPDVKDAPKVIRRFRDRMAKAYKKQGWIFKYIITCETGSRGAVHWHMIINNMHNENTDTAKLIQKLWTRGRPRMVPLDDTGDYSKLADYIVKETDRRIQEGSTIEKLSYMRSRNLKKPVIRTEKVKSNRWRANPHVPEGWHLVPGTLYNGINKFTGLPYQYYTIAKGSLQWYEEPEGRDSFVPEEVMPDAGG